MGQAGELQKREMRETIDRVMDFLKKTSACFIAARKQIASVKGNQQFPLNYSPDEIMRMNHWERESHQVEKEIAEMQSLMDSYQGNFSFYQKGMRQWLATLHERSTSIVPLIQRR
jgi:hypothetical protein